MKKSEVIGFVLGGVCLSAALTLILSNGGKPFFGGRETEYFVMEVGKGVSDLAHRNRTLGDIAEVWSGRK